MNLTCPTCQSTLDAPEHFVGKQVQCPKCKNVFTAQDPSSPRGAAPPYSPPVYNPPPAPSPPPYGGPPEQRSWERQEAAWERSWERDPYGGPPAGYGPPGYGGPPMGAGYGTPYGYRPPPPLDEAQGQSVAARAGNLLTTNGILTLITMVFMITGLFLLPRRPHDEAGFVCGVAAIFLLFFPTGLFGISGGISLKRLRGKGLATTSVVFDYIMATVLGFTTLALSVYILANLSERHRVREPLAEWCFAWVMVTGCTVFNLIAAIVGTTALSNYHLTRCVEKNQRGETATV